MEKNICSYLISLVSATAPSVKIFGAKKKKLAELRSLDLSQSLTASDRANV